MKDPSTKRSSTKKKPSKEMLIADAVAADLLFGTDSSLAIKSRWLALEATRPSLKSIRGKTLLNKEAVHRLHDSFCQTSTFYKASLRRLVEKLTDPQLQQLARYFRRQVGPNKRHNFPIESYLEFAQVCRQERWVRRQCRIADAREARKKGTVHAKKKSNQRNRPPIAKRSKNRADEAAGQALAARSVSKVHRNSRL